MLAILALLRGSVYEPDHLVGVKVHSLRSSSSIAVTGGCSNTLLSLRCPRCSLWVLKRVFSAAGGTSTFVTLRVRCGLSNYTRPHPRQHTVLQPRDPCDQSAWLGITLTSTGRRSTPSQRSRSCMSAAFVGQIVADSTPSVGSRTSNDAVQCVSVACPDPSVSNATNCGTAPSLSVSGLSKASRSRSSTSRASPASIMSLHCTTVLPAQSNAAGTTKTSSTLSSPVMAHSSWVESRLTAMKQSCDLRGNLKNQLVATAYSEVVGDVRCTA